MGLKSFTVGPPTDIGWHFVAYLFEPNRWTSWNIVRQRRFWLRPQRLCGVDVHRFSER
jgi:hypothetical protein